MLSLKTLAKISPKKIQGKRVLVRVDFNVTMEKGKVKEDFRIKAVLPTIKYLVKNKAKVILLSHLGRPDEKKNSFNGNQSENLSLEPIAKYLGRVLKKKVGFVPDCIGERTREAVAKMKFGDIVVFENLRFYPEEEKNDDWFAQKLAENGDFYVNDAFAVSHRNHASVVAITKFLPATAGFLMAKEAETLTKAYTHPKKPLCIVMGGGKISTKMNLIMRFFDKADHILIGGALANTLLSAKGYAIGKSKAEPSMVEKMKDFNIASTKIHLPVDTIVVKKISADEEVKIKGVGNIEDDEIILDIGPDTAYLFGHIAAESKMVIWNGPLGYFEIDKFAEGTNEFAKALAKAKAFEIIGGGDTIAAIDKLKLLNKFDFVSTGGGAMLEFLAGEKLPGIEALKA